jgi:DNA modification methylase
MENITVDTKSKERILNGKKNAEKARAQLDMIFGEIPDTVWTVHRDRSQKVIAGKSQTGNAQKKKSTTDKIFDNSPKYATCRDGLSLSIFPQEILRKLIKFYAPKNGTYLDPFAGHNSRMQVAYEERMNYIGYDISKEFMAFNREVKQQLLSQKTLFQDEKDPEITLKEQDSRTIDEEDNSADFCFTSPPYYDLEFYGDEAEQLGKCKTYEDFLDDMQKVYNHCYRVLKPGSFCIINVNDFRKDGIFHNYHGDTTNLLKKAGFKQFDLIVMKYTNAFRKAFPQQIIDSKYMPKIHEFIIVMRK